MLVICGLPAHSARLWNTNTFTIVGSIPAHAGNSFFALRLYIPTHGSSPRMRGTPCHQVLRVGPEGSSPRMRGTPSRPCPGLRLDRFIPAHAGNSALAGPTPISRSVHPRACGELHFRICSSLAVCGSSPRMRGTLCSTRARYALRRFIPAHAGNSHSGLRDSLPSSVHPRACGELIYSYLIYSSIGGSTPRMRGTRK